MIFNSIAIYSLPSIDHIKYQAGIRDDGRKPLEPRESRCELGVSNEADGSALLSAGKTSVCAMVYGPAAPRYNRLELHDRCSVQVDYFISSKVYSLS